MNYKPLGITIDKLTVLGDIVCHKDHFHRMIKDLGFSLMDYKSKKYGYSFVYIGENNSGFIEFAQERKFVDAVDLTNRKNILQEKLKDIRETGINNTGESFAELVDRLNHYIELLEQCDERGYVDRLKDIRYEFNPKYHKYYPENKLISQKIISNLEKIRVSSIHIAIDYGLPINSIEVVDTQLRKETSYHGKDKKLETRYFGAKSSRNQIVMYDKKKENDDNGSIDQYPDEPFITRFEARLKNNRASDFIESDYNPFSNIKITSDKKTSLKSNKNLTIKEKAMISWYLDNPDDLLEEPETTRRRWKKKIDTIFELDINLENDFIENKKALVGELEQLMYSKKQIVNSIIRNMKRRVK